MNKVEEALAYHKQGHPMPVKGISTQACTSSPVTSRASPSVDGMKPIATRAGIFNEWHMSIMRTAYCSSSPMRSSALTIVDSRTAPCPGSDGDCVPSE